MREIPVSESIVTYLLNVNWLAEDVKTFVSGQALGHVPEKEPELP